MGDIGAQMESMQRQGPCVESCHLQQQKTLFNIGGRLFRSAQRQIGERRSAAAAGLRGERRISVREGPRGDEGADRGLELVPADEAGTEPVTGASELRG